MRSAPDRGARSVQITPTAIPAAQSTPITESERPGLRFAIQAIRSETSPVNANVPASGGRPRKSESPTPPYAAWAIPPARIT